MARHTGWTLAFCVLIGSVAQISANPRSQMHDEQQGSAKKDEPKKDEKNADEHRGPWIWWKDEAAKAELKLTADQVAEVDRIFQTNMAKAKPLREEITQLEAALNQTMRANTAEVAVVSQQVDKVESKRAELNKMRVLMLYRMHRVLTPEQNARFQAMVERWDAARKRDASSGVRRR
jgi:Spy/CpxP family protein refolding chaperone